MQFDQYTARPENVFEDAVVQRSGRGYNCFVLRSRAAVALAVREGATRLIDAGLTFGLDEPE